MKIYIFFFFSPTKQKKFLFSEIDEELRNQATAYLDASFLYDNKDDESNVIVREPDGSLYHKFHTKSNTTTTSPFEKVIMTFLVNEHNRICEILRNKFPKWNVETLFEETRRVLIAEIQHITLAEYLPMLLGEQLVEVRKTKISRPRPRPISQVSIQLWIRFRSCRLNLFEASNVSNHETYSRPMQFVT